MPDSAPIDTRSNEGVALRLSEGWQINFDSLQWIVCRGRNLRSGRKWQPVAYIAARKSSLLRILAEYGAEITPGAEATLTAWPDTFRQWRAQREGR